MKDYYSILGVPPTALPEAINRAFKALAKKYHPDKNPDDPEAETKFNEIGEANAVIGDAEKRAEYDKDRSSALVTDIRESAAQVVSDYFNQLNPNI